MIKHRQTPSLGSNILSFFQSWKTQFLEDYQKIVDSNNI